MVAVFTHVRSVQASPEIRIKTAEGTEPVGIRGESGGQTSPHGPNIRARRAPSVSVCGESVECLSGLRASGAWSLQSVEKLRRAEETELGARLSLLCHAELRVHVRNVARAGESSPASAKRSEVIGFWHSSSIAEGRTGS